MFCTSESKAQPHLVWNVSPRLLFKNTHCYIFRRLNRSSHYGTMRLAASLQCEDAGSIPSPLQWVKNTALLHCSCNCGSDLIKKKKMLIFPGKQSHLQRNKALVHSEKNIIIVCKHNFALPQKEERPIMLNFKCIFIKMSRYTQNHN